MNSDATEAALGLLGLSPLNAPQSHPQPQPHPHHHVAHAHGPSLTSSSVGIAIDRTSAPHIVQSALPPSLVPLKRKQPSPALPSPTATPLTPSFLRDGLSTMPRQPSHPLATSSTPPIKSNRPLPSVSTKPSTPVPSQRQPQRPFSPSSILPQTPPPSQFSLPSPSTSQHPLIHSDAPPPSDSDAISCICGFTYDDGFSIACDDCSRWCHAACFGIIQGEVPEFWKCWVCDPALVVDKERAVKTQKGRLRAMRMKASHATNGGVPGTTAVNGAGGNAALEEGNGVVGKPASRRKPSPGAERKSRRGSAVAAAIEGSGPSRKKRRASMFSPDPSSPSIPPSNYTSTQPQSSNSRIPHSNGNGAVATSLPPTPVTFPPDIYPNPAVYAQLLRVAKAWRGVTALNPPSPLMHPPPKTFNEGGYTMVDSQGYHDRYGYSMSPLDNTTPVILDENAGDMFVPRTVLRIDPSSGLHSGLHSQRPPPSATCTPAHLRPPSPRLHAASDPPPSWHTSIYPSPPISNHMSPPVPSSSRPRARPPLTPSTNTPHSNGAIPATTLLAPYTATVIPSATYLADPLNGYAHLGMGKPQVRLVGGGWGVGLDARGIGEVPDPPDLKEKGNGDSGKEDGVDGKARWARCGCWPNAVVRPVICGGTNGERKKRGLQHNVECAKAASGGGVSETDSPRTVNGRSTPPIPRTQGQHASNSSDQEEVSPVSDTETDSTTLSFALFALRDLRADEEIVLGWEWDDGHAVHMLPALMECPGMFAPAHLHHLRAQFTSILHALSSTFTTCACGASTRDCAVRVMERVVEGRWPWPGGEMMSEGSEGDSSDVDGASEASNHGEEEIDVEGDVSLDPRSSRALGLGMNVDVDIEMNGSIEADPRTRRVKKRKVKKKAEDADDGKDMDSAMSTVKPKTRKPIDLGPLVGVKRGFRTREKAPMSGGWGGVEIVPSSLRPFPDVRVEDSPMGSKGKEKARVDDGDDMDVDHLSTSMLPPRMRMAWNRPSVAQSDPLQENAHQPKRAERWRPHERWRGPPNMSTDSPVSVSDAVAGSGDPKQGSVAVNGDGEDGGDGQETEFDTETEPDGSDDARQMPPPPMPASLDPTTVSSLAHAHTMRSSSPRGSIQWDKGGASATWVPPRTPTPTSASTGRSCQPPNQNSSTGAPGSSTSTTTHHPAPPQIDPDSKSPSTSFPQTQAHLLPLSASVSPSVTFSKLSLHSPDASSSPHLSVLFCPTESTSLLSGSAPTQPTSDRRATSPPLHRPSKPLHVHPQNELPSLSPSVSVPVETSNSSDGTRDTPAEAQYQQPYRCSPEAWQETHSHSDVEKRRLTNGEAHRVRFASPEVLCGLPRLKGRGTLDSSEPLDVDGVSANTNQIEVVNDQEAASLSRDDMDVDAVGDDGKRDGTSRTSSGNREDELSLAHVPGSPHPSAPLDAPPHSIPAAMDGTGSEKDTLPIASDAHETTLQTDPMTVEPESSLSVRGPSPPPPPKVKLSLKDFALRKKKQREEEMAAKSLHSPASPDAPGLPSSPTVDMKRDLVSERTGIRRAAGSGEVVNSHDVKMKDATKGHSLDTYETGHGGANGVDVGGNEHSVARGPQHLQETVEDNKLSAETHVPSIITPPDSTSHAMPPSPRPARVPDEGNSTDRTQMQVDKKTAKMEIMEVMVPGGIDDRTPDVVSFAPEPPPPPLTTKQACETAIIDRIVAVGSALRSVPSTPASVSTSTTSSAVNSRSNSVGITSTPNLNLSLYAQGSGPSSSTPLSRRPSHEDGEITNSAPKTYLPRSHTPPTQPRSFHTVHTALPNLGPTSSSTTPVPRRPAPPLSRSPLSNAVGPTPTAISSRPLPSGPRALRGSMSQPTHPPPYVSTRPPYAGSQYIPRGPSADRDWERSDRQWVAQTRPRGRAGSNGWGR